jgi:hypothetical protein
MKSPVHALALAVLVASALVAPAVARAQVPLINGFGGTAGYGPDTNCLYPNDDSSSSVIDIRPAFATGLNFFGTTHTNVYVNTNGNITFSAPLGTYTPNPFPVASRPMIAPYWGDVDIRNLSPGGGAVSGTACHHPTENGVWWYLEPGRMVVTWDRVGYYSSHNDRRMSFQLILTAANCGPGALGNFNVEFRYNRCEWTTGDASGGSGGFGGTPAQAGFDAGNLRDFVEIPGSRTGTIHTLLCTTSNVGMPGIWQFAIRGGMVMCPGAGSPCSTGRPGICAAGRTECVGTGTPTCASITAAGARRCNGLDNDCDGMIDTGEDLCPAGFVCDRSTCTPRCVEGGCFPGEVCTRRGTCVEAACADVECPAGQRCIAGACVGACTGVTCPANRVCRNGECVDPCAGVTCEMGTHCTDGVCVVDCPCRGCMTGEACLMGRCITPACAAAMCPAGTVCRTGACVDACDGAVCPRGQRCLMGDCVPDNSAPDAGAPDIIVPPLADSGTSAMPDAGMSDGTGGAGSEWPTRRAYCSCEVPGRSRGAGPAGLAGMIAVAAAGAIVRRRRRGRARRSA